MIHSILGNRILWLRTRDYVQQYKPTLIGITGSAHTGIAQQAITTLLTKNHHVRSPQQQPTTPIGVANAILGVSVNAHQHWLQLLMKGRAKELAREEPDTIITTLAVNKPGDIDITARKLPFTCGVVTNVHTEKVSRFTSAQMLAHEMTSLITTLPETGYAILNADDPLVYEMRHHTKAKTFFFGTAPHATVALRRCHRLPSYGLACEIVIQGKIHELHLQNIISQQQVHAVLAALTVAVALEEEGQKTYEVLRTLVPAAGNLNKIQGRKEALIIDGSCNATPESMYDALQVLKEIATTSKKTIRRKIAVLGTLEDIGTQALQWQEKLGTAAATGAHVVITVGENMNALAKHALNGGADVHHFETSAEAGKWLAPFIKQQDLVLICGPRKIKLEEAIQRLKREEEKGDMKKIRN